MKKIERIDEHILSTLINYTLPQILEKQAQSLGLERTAIREKNFGIWQAYNWNDYFQYTKKVGLGLAALGLKRCENVAIITNNHPEWLFTELGAQAIGAVTLNLFTSSVSKELAFGLTRIQAVFVIAEDQEQVDKLLEVREKISFVKKVVYIDPTGMRGYANNPWLMSFRELLALGADLDRKKPTFFSDELHKGKPDDIALMIMTSGTTGLPKLAMVKHENFAEMARKWLETAPIGIGDNWISITPPAWIVDQMWGVGIALAGGMVMNFPETLETSEEDVREIGPTVIVTASRFWEELASKIRVKISDASFINRAFYKICMRIGGEVVDRESKKIPVPLYLRILYWISSIIIFKPLMDRVGSSHFRVAYTGGHPISPDVIRFFRANGLNLKQCYGLTEACGIFQVQPDDEVKLETVGVPLPRTNVKIAADQEVLVSSKSNFAGYYQDPDETNKSITNGWLHTGDAGYIDEEGHLLIIGRKEEIMRTRDGEAFSPDFIETRLKFSPYIKEAVIFGEGQPFITAFINIDFGNVGNWAEERKIPYTTYTDLSQRPEIEDLIKGEILQVNTQLPKPMQLVKFILLYKLLDADDEELTRTGKVRRKFVSQQYKDLINAMYFDKKELAVTGQVKYRDGHVGTIETTVKILSVE